MERTLPAGPENSGQYITAQGVLRRMVRSWPLLVFLIVLSIAAAIMIVRLSPPTYAATMSMTKAGEAKVGALSVLSQAAGMAGAADDSSTDELRATLMSRLLATRLLREEPIAVEIEHWLAPKSPTFSDNVRRTVSQVLFGQKRGYQPQLLERLRFFLISNLTVETEKGVLQGRLKSYDRTFSEHLLKAAMTDARDIMRQRQQTRAVAAREFLSQTLAERSSQLSTQVVNDQMSRAIGDTIMALSPSSDRFIVIDEAYAEERPVSPKAGLISAICLALGLIIFCGFVTVHELVARSRA